MKEFIYLECRLRDALGISDGLIKKTRKSILVKGNDFDLVNGKIAYTKATAHRVINHLQNSDASSASTKAKVDVVNRPEILAAALIQPVPGEKQADSADGAGETPAVRSTKLLEGPWEVPDCEMKFHKRPRNPRILQGRIPEEWVKLHGHDFFHRIGIDPRRPQRIRVKDNSKFTERMVVPCRWVQADLWECTQRMPKGRGRW